MQNVHLHRLLSLVILPFVSCIGIATEHVMISGTEDFYVGLKAGKRTMGFEKNYGGDFFSKRLNQYGIFAGVNLFDYFGVELEYFNAPKKVSYPVVAPFQTEFGDSALSGLNTSKYKASNKISGASVQLKAQYPVLDCLKVFAAGGFSRVSLKARGDLIAVDGQTPTASEIQRDFISIKTHKVVPKFSLGLDYKFADHFGMKAETSLEKTNKISKSFTNFATGQDSFVAKLKNSSIYSLSFYANF